MVIACIVVVLLGVVIGIARSRPRAEPAVICTIAPSRRPTPEPDAVARETAAAPDAPASTQFEDVFDVVAPRREVLCPVRGLPCATAAACQRGGCRSGRDARRS